MIPVVLTAAAEADLESIADWIAAENPAAAADFIAELRESCTALGLFPNRFAIVPRYRNRNIRQRPYRNYLIFYRAQDMSVEILRIIHGARDYGRLLSSLGAPT